MIYRRFLKRFFDFTLALIGLIILSPLLGIIALLIKLQDGGSVFFKQTRVGQNGKLFQIYKFRTMVENADKMGPPITGGEDPRITKIGKFLRKYKLDELPQLINVLKGEMSFVGPRPEVPKYVKLFEEEYREILKVKPGITDYAAIEFVNEEEILKGADNVEKVYIEKVLPRKIEYYKRYLKEISFSTDLKIILKTLWSIVK